MTKIQTHTYYTHTHTDQTSRTKSLTHSCLLHFVRPANDLMGWGLVCTHTPFICQPFGTPNCDPHWGVNPAKYQVTVVVLHSSFLACGIVCSYSATCRMSAELRLSLIWQAELSWCWRSLWLTWSYCVAHGSCAIILPQTESINQICFRVCFSSASHNNVSATPGFRQLDVD